MAPSSIHIGFGAVFATVALYAGWKFISYKQTMVSFRQQQFKPSRLPERDHWILNAAPPIRGRIDLIRATTLTARSLVTYLRRSIFAG